MHDAPTLRGYTFSRPPSENTVEWEKIFIKHKLANGAIRTYFKGYRPYFTLRWKDEWLTADDFSNLCVIYNDTSATLSYLPRPDTYSGTTFNVYITNDFEFTPHDDQLESINQKYEGRIEMEGISITATCTNWVV